MLLLDVSTLQGPELHLEVSGQQETTGLDVSTSQGAELYLDMSTLQWPMLHLEVSTPQVPEPHLDVFGQKEPLLLLDVCLYITVHCTGA